ncbi:MAG: 23S rRNA pseudouridine2605 synthase [Rhodobacteraceae bacterium HLUCCA12]|nr:MAG: 23S rRNA pseudouridine2605 synthase [Rhodobacteraceae bacterium HLUCCA12]
MPKPNRPKPRPASRAEPDSAGQTTGARIAKVLARAGVASRREAETMILAGRVQVNGSRIDSPALNVGPSDRVMVDGKPLAAPEPPRLWLYHKPTGLVTSARDEKGRPTVFDTLPDDLPRVMSVGRLDINSEGLLLLTNDGALKRRLELPSTGWLRKYRVRVKGAPQEAALEPLRKGLVIEGERFQPMVVSLDRQQGANAWLTVGIREGRNREVRRAMEAVGLSVNRLIRISYGPFQLGDLAPGAVEEIRPKVLRDQLGSDAAGGDPATPPARKRPQKAAGTGPSGRDRAGGKGDSGTEKPTRRSWGTKSWGGKATGQATGEDSPKPRSWGRKSAQPSQPAGPRKPPRTQR